MEKKKKKREKCWVVVVVVREEQNREQRVEGFCVLAAILFVMVFIVKKERGVKIRERSERGERG